MEPAEPLRARSAGLHTLNTLVTRLTPTQKGQRDGASNLSWLLRNEQAARQPLMGAGCCCCPASRASSPGKKQSRWSQPPGIRFTASLSTSPCPPDLQAFTLVGKLLLAW